MDGYITLPLKFVVELITNSPPAYLPTRPVSRLPNIPDFSPGIVRYEIGALLKELDSKEELVKVFLYPETEHAEVWLIGEWLNSTTHLLQIKRESSEYREELLQREESRRKEHELMEDLTEFLKKFLNTSSTTTAVIKLAQALVRAVKINDDIVDQFPGLRQFLASKGYE